MILTALFQILLFIWAWEALWFAGKVIAAIYSSRAQSSAGGLLERGHGMSNVYQLRSRRDPSWVAMLSDERGASN